MGKPWVHKEKPVPISFVLREQLAMEHWAYRTAFYERRRIYTAQPRKPIQVLMTIYRRQCFKKINDNVSDKSG